MICGSSDGQAALKAFFQVCFSAWAIARFCILYPGFKARAKARNTMCFRNSKAIA